MRVKAIFCCALMCAALLGSAAQAYAVSAITNSFTMSDQSINTNQVVSCTAKTVYDSVLIKNPYSSSFYTEMNADHFNKPATTGYTGFSSVTWLYKSTGRFTTPSYAFDSGTLWFNGINKVTKSVSYTGKAKAASKGSRRTNRHGQYQAASGMDSIGGQVVKITTHN